MSDSVADLGGLKLIDLSVPLEDAAVSEPMLPSIHYMTHEAEGLAQMQQFFGIDPDDLVYSNGQGQRGLVPCGGVGVRGAGVTRASRRLR